MDLNTFMSRGREGWEELETLLEAIDRGGMESLSASEAQAFARLYRQVSSDLVRARSLTSNQELLGYLNVLVGRSYGQITTGQRLSVKGIWRFLSEEYPSLVRVEKRLVLLSAGIFFVGVMFGAGAMWLDNSAGLYLLPKDHLHLEPSERVAKLTEEMSRDGVMSVESQAYFSSYLFTHNIQVTFLTFALGLTFGVGTCLILFMNGVSIGALAMNYHMSGEGLFFYAWILPHGVPELMSIFIAGGAGLVLSRAFWRGGRQGLRMKMRREGERAMKMLMGTMMLLVLAGVIEGTVSQMHPPVLAYGFKLSLALGLAVVLQIYLARGGAR